MNTNHLKRFAQNARIKLMDQVAARLEWVLNADSAELREKTKAIKALQEAINKSSKEQVIEKAAYTWFNRLVALRYMDVNDFQPLGIKIVTPKPGYTSPEILDEAKQGLIPKDLPINRQHVQDLLNGVIPSVNPQNEAYKEILIAVCNHLNIVFPFLFETINDYTELLLPDDLTSEFSIAQDFRDGMSKEDCKAVEIIGWLYQFYISEKKDEVFAQKGKVKKEDIPAVTQLFTPHWIVEYMVQNTVGKLWLQNRPHSDLKSHMPFFIESESLKSPDYLHLNSIEELTLLDSACGSGHVLVYAFELFTKIYEEEGYNPIDIPKLIIEKNLHGFEIDERAAQLSGLALMLKARSYQRGIFNKHITPNILCYEDFSLDELQVNTTFREMGIVAPDTLEHDLKTMQQATNLGSLIIPHTKEEDLLVLLSKIDDQQGSSDAFLNYNIQEIKSTIEQLLPLRKKYSCFVTNPPYMGGKAMNKELTDFVKTNYPDSKADLMACFMESGLYMLQAKGFLGMINQHSWMFLSSYEKLRNKLINNIFFDTLLHLGPRTFPEIGGEVVQNASFTFWNTQKEAKGSYIRLVDQGSSELKRSKTLEAIQNPNCAWFFTANQKDFEKIPGTPIGYWASKNQLKVLNSKTLSDFGDPREGMATGRDLKYIREWFEVPQKEILFSSEGNSNYRWFPYNKDGSYRKWYGNQCEIVDWYNEGEELQSTVYPNGKRIWAHNFNLEYIFKEFIGWSSFGSSEITVRKYPKGFLFDSSGLSYFPFNSNNINIVLSFVNSKIVSKLAPLINSGLSFKPGYFGRIPFPTEVIKNLVINELSQSCVEISTVEWNIRETSWDFLKNELMRIGGQNIKESYESYKQYWENKFFQLHQNEEELNRQFIEIYGLQDELTPDVPLEDITILKDETKIVNNELIFNAREVFAQFMSYAVGCMFGRYSLDKEGLILANQGESLADYFKKLEKAKGDVSFLPDDNNIIPILDDEWFEDDIANRFLDFLKVSFGTEHFQQNLAFIEESLGKDIRKYFIRDFYKDQVKRYKKRPIYWMFSSPKGSFNVLIYVHRYTPDTLNQILNSYLKEYKEKLRTRLEHLDHLIETGSSAEQTKAAHEKDKLRIILMELKDYERDILFPLATERIQIDLDDGVLVNYNKFGKAIKEVPGLNDKKTKEKVTGFDWIDSDTIR